MMKLSATRREFEVADESGYRFKVITEFNPDTGWDAGVAFSANGFKHEADAVHHLLPAIQHFLRMNEWPGDPGWVEGEEDGAP